MKPFNDTSLVPPVRGFLHRPGDPNGDGLVLTHGAGSNCNSPLLVALAQTSAEAGLTVLRCDLPYRHSYGGRQATMLCADQPGLVDGLLLLSYPLHPPRKPTQLRTQHLPKLQTPALLIHGTRDPFGSIEEMEAAIKLIPSKVELLPVDGSGHDLGFKGKTKREDLPAALLAAFQGFFR